MIASGVSPSTMTASALNCGVLEAAQAGSSWTIVLKKQEGYRHAFDGFQPDKVARYSARRIEKLALNSPSFTTV